MTVARWVSHGDLFYIYFFQVFYMILPLHGEEKEGGMKTESGMVKPTGVFYRDWGRVTFNMS